MSAKLVLEESTHRYTLDGRPIGGVTSIIAALGLTDTRWFTTWARDRGQAVHIAMDLYIRGTLDWSTVDDRILGFVKAGVKFLTDAGADLKQLKSEHKVVHPALFYAGKADVIGTLFGREAVGDFKSGALGHAAVQLAAYEWAYRPPQTRPLDRIAIALKEDGTYSMKRYTSPDDYIDWSACCRLYNKYHLGKDVKE